jgi:hypothetical protein
VRRIANPPGRDAVDYRVGDYRDFRRALLAPRAGEVALAGWHPTPGTDLALQLLEWWAYLADVLTFYNERAIQGSLLRTAWLPEDVRRIVRLLGYRPRPGIGATGVVAALSDAADPFVVPRGFAIEGAAATGQPAQVFELDEDVEIGRVGRPLPVSARFGAASGLAATGPKNGVVVRDGRGRLRDSVGADEQRPPESPAPAGAPFPIFLDGVVSSVGPGDILLLLRRGWGGHMIDPFGYAVAVVRSIRPIFDAAGRPFTELVLLAAQAVPAPPAQCQLLRPTQLAHLWLYHQRYPGSTNPALLGVSAVAQVVQSIFDPLGLFHGGGPPSRPPEDPRVLAGLSVAPGAPPHGVAHLEAITRGLKAGDPVLFEKRSGGGLAGIFQRLIDSNVPPAVLAPLRMLIMQLVKVSGYAEDIWYANAPQMDRIGQGPPVGPPAGSVLSNMQGAEGPIPIPHSRINFDPNPFLDIMALGDLDLDKIVIHFGWEEIGEQVVPPAAGPVESVAISSPPPEVPPGVPVPAIVRDRNGKGVPGWLGQTAPTEGVDLVPPLEALINLLPISRGKTVRREVLGSGDPTRVRQEFALAQSPLTYLADTTPGATGGYRSTLRIRVDGIEWREVESFFEQPPDARVFVTREDEQQQTHVRFGDGENGARLPAGVDNVVADYRVGSGAAIPPVGTLRSIVRPQPGLDAVVDPLPVGGGADPDPPGQLRRYAPRSVLTFGRAVSGDDYETVAAQTPGVSRARATWGWDPASQRTVVKVFVGDDDAAVTAARASLLAFADPNRPMVVARATPILIDLTLVVVVDPAHQPEVVQAAVVAALLDPRRHPFGTEVIRIGDSIYDSQIHDVCLAVPGAVAVHGLRFATWTLAFQALPIAPPAPAPIAIGDLFGPGFIPDEAFEPLTLAVRIGVPEAAMRDPFALADHFGSRAPADPGQTPPTGPVELIQLDPSARHTPGEGRFYLLREERLHVSTETARHVV